MDRLLHAYPGLQNLLALTSSLQWAMRDELFNESLFFGIGHACSAIAAWVADYNTERPHSSLGYATPADFARMITATTRHTQ